MQPAGLVISVYDSRLSGSMSGLTRKIFLVLSYKKLLMTARGIEFDVPRRAHYTAGPYCHGHHKPYFEVSTPENTEN